MFGSKICLGIDIGSDDIKIVELHKSGRQYEVAYAACLALPERRTSADIGAAIAQYLEKTQTTPDEIASSLPADLCAIKTAQLPWASPADLAKVVHFEATTQIPLPLSDMVWGYTPGRDRTENLCHVLIAGARRTAVEEHMAIFESAFLRPTAVMVSSLAGVLAAHSPEAGQGPSLVLDIEKERTDLCLVEGERVRGCRSVRYGGNELAAAFAEDAGIDVEEANTLLREQGIPIEIASARRKYSATARWMTCMAAEVKQSIESFANSGEGVSPFRVILIGGTAGIAGVAEALKAEIGLPVELGNPWQDMRISAVCSRTLSEPALTFAVATGLAKAKLDAEPIVNLLPVRVTEGQNQQRSSFVAFAALSMLVVALLLITITLAQTSRDINAQLATVDKQLRGARQHQQTGGRESMTDTQAIRQVVLDIERRDTRPLDILRLISINLPHGLTLSDFSYENGKAVVLKGSATSNSVVADAVDNMAQMGIFQSTLLDFSNLKTTNGSQEYEFQITCAFPPSVKQSKSPKVSAKKADGNVQKTGIVVQ